MLFPRVYKISGDFIDSMIRVLSVLLFVLVLLILLLLLVLLVLLALLLIVFRLLHEWSPPKISDEEIEKSLDTSMARQRENIHGDGFSKDFCWISGRLFYLFAINFL